MPNNLKSFQDFLQDLPLTIPTIPTTLNLSALDHVLQNLTIPEGLCVECGVYSGTSINKIAHVVDPRKVYGFDSFEGLPESWQRPDMQFGKGAFDLRGRLPLCRPNVTLVPGWFDKTLPAFAAEHVGEKIGLLHVDCDLYSSTKCVFESLGHMLKHGTVIVFDELLDYPTYEEHEVKAFYEFLTGSGFDVEWIGKLGDVNLAPVKDRGAAFQAVACRLLSLRGCVARCKIL
jgi:hypothetical protein